MKITVENEFENPMLNRTQYDIKIEDVEKTPKREEVLNKFAAKIGVDSKKVIVDTISTKAGLTYFKAYIKIYKDIESLKKIELKQKIVKWEKLNTPKEVPKEEPKVEAPVEAPAEKAEAPKEEIKEEPKVEEAKAEVKVEEPKVEEVKETPKEEIKKEPKAEEVKEEKKE
jgi:ribosomal protein S24E